MGDDDDFLGGGLCFGQSLVDPCELTERIRRIRHRVHIVVSIQQTVQCYHPQSRHPWDYLRIVASAIVLGDSVSGEEGLPEFGGGVKEPGFGADVAKIEGVGWVAFVVAEDWEDDRSAVIVSNTCESQLKHLRKVG